jgi:hypothetical protein
MVATNLLFAPAYATTARLLVLLIGLNYIDLTGSIYVMHDLNTLPLDHTVKEAPVLTDDVVACLSPMIWSRNLPYS